MGQNPQFCAKMHLKVQQKLIRGFYSLRQTNKVGIFIMVLRMFCLGKKPIKTYPSATAQQENTVWENRKRKFYNNDHHFGRYPLTPDNPSQLQPNLRTHFHPHGLCVLSSISHRMVVHILYNKHLHTVGMCTYHVSI